MVLILESFLYCSQCSYYSHYWISYYSYWLVMWVLYYSHYWISYCSQCSYYSYWLVM